MIGVVVSAAAKSVALLKTNWHLASATLNRAINQTEQCTINELESWEKSRPPCVLDLAVNGIDCAAACHTGSVRECTMGFRDFVTLQTVTLCDHRDLQGRLYSLVFLARVLLLCRTFSVGKLLIGYCVQSVLLHEAGKNEMLTLKSPVVTICTAKFNIHKSYVLPTQCIYVFCVDLKKTAIISLHNINWLVFITETESVYCAVQTEYLYVILYQHV